MRNRNAAPATAQRNATAPVVSCQTTNATCPLRCDQCSSLLLTRYWIPIPEHPYYIADQGSLLHPLDQSYSRNEKRHIISCRRIFGGRIAASLFFLHRSAASDVIIPCHQHQPSHGGVQPLPRRAVPDLLRAPAPRRVRVALPSERTGRLRDVESEHHDRSDCPLVRGGGRWQRCQCQCLKRCSKS